MIGGRRVVDVDRRATVDQFSTSPTFPPTVVMDGQKQLQALSNEFQQLQTGNFFP